MKLFRNLILGFLLSSGGIASAQVFQGMTNPGTLVRYGYANQGGSSGGGTDAEIDYYFDFNSLSTPQSPQKGTNQVTIGASCRLGVGVVGNAIDNGNTGGSGGRMTFSTAGFSNTEGSFAFYFCPLGFSAGHLFSGTAAETNPQLDLRYRGSGNQMEFYYKDNFCRVPTSGGLVQGTTYFIVGRYSDSNAITGGVGAKLEAYDLSGSLIANGSDTANLTGSPPTLDANWTIGPTDSNVWFGIFDNFFHSTNPNKDLTSIRNSINP